MRIRPSLSTAQRRTGRGRSISIQRFQERFVDLLGGWTLQICSVFQNKFSALYGQADKRAACDWSLDICSRPEQ
jgi:hypothetical protein